MNEKKSKMEDKYGRPIVFDHSSKFTLMNREQKRAMKKRKTK